MDEVIRYAGELGLAIILDNHSRDPDGYMNEKLWYSKSTSEEQWIADWVMLANRYADNPTVIALDLNNEPHGKASDGGATWGTGNLSTDWNSAAQKCGNAILKVNSDVLIIIEGVEQAESVTYWWGGNLRGVKTAPIQLIEPDKLVYSAHEYGPEVFQQPWFENAAFPDNLPGIWNDAFGFITKNNIAPLFIGEFGIKDMKSYNGKSGTWFSTFMKFMTDNFYSWTFWCFNPNSGDTGGILSYDWVTVEQWKIDTLKASCAPLINTPVPVLKKSDRRLPGTPRLAFDHNRLKCSAIPGAELKVFGINGKLVASTSSFPAVLRMHTSGYYIAMLFAGARMVDRIAFTVD